MTDDPRESRRLGIVLLPVRKIMTTAVADLLPGGTTVIGLDAGMTGPDALAIAIAHPDLSEVPEGTYPPLVEVRSGLRYVETGWRKVHTSGFRIEHGTYGEFEMLFTDEPDSHDERVRSDVCVCKHSPEGHALSGCTVRGCDCRARPTAPPAFPGFTGARVDL